MTDTAKNSAAAEEGVYETPEDIAAEAAKPAERAARTDADSPIAPVDPFEPGSLGWLLPWAETGEGDVLTPDEALEVFLEWVDARGMELWPHQEDALMDLAVGDSRDSGHAHGLRQVHGGPGPAASWPWPRGASPTTRRPSRRSCREKFFDHGGHPRPRERGHDHGRRPPSTPRRPVICCTAEILANQALREGPASKVACVVMDEFHFYADPDRGWAWQVPLLTLPNAQFLLMSATLGDVTDIAERRSRSAPGAPVDLVTDAPAPRAAVLRLHLRDPGSHRRAGPARRRGADVHRAFLPGRGAEERAGAGQLRRVGQGPARGDQAGHEGHEVHDPLRQDPASGCSAAGVGVHHAGMLPRYRLLVETPRPAGAACRSSAAPTRSASASTCPSTPWCSRSSPSSTAPRCAACARREFHQIVGRAGRAGLRHRGHGGGARPPSTRSRTTRRCSRPATTRRSSAA